MGNEDFTPQRVADRLEIEDVMMRWCRAVDRLDLDRIREVFHPDAIDRHGPFNGGVEELIAWIRKRHAAIPFSMHSLDNMLIEFAGPDAALVETYVRTVQYYPASAKASLAELTGGAAGAEGAGADLFTCSRYVDRFERRQGRWKIAMRTLVQDYKRVVEVPVDVPAGKPGWFTGRRDAQDPLFAERAAMGLA